ncbi:MAG: RNA-binding transcriptional accessory protein [Chloroflexi bacterium SZAS-1]|nr:RNA-binding transcriptional accessory protein [Chloroflexi bacterium SZAS-1]
MSIAIDTIELRLARELKLGLSQVTRTIALFDEGNTIPFITRYRKEATGGLDEAQLRVLAERLHYLRNLEARRAEVRAALEQGDHLTPELATQLDAAETLQAIEDIYLPFRPKRRTRAQIAREQGLQPLADALLAQDSGGQSRDDLAVAFVQSEQGVADIEAAYAGARDIVAETIAETATVRQAVREATRKTGVLRVARKDETTDAEGKYQLYYEFGEHLATLPPHRILAINRGEREGALKVEVDANHAAFVATLQRRYAKAPGWLGDEVRAAVADGYKRLLAPAIERDLRGELTERAEAHALTIFAANLRGLLLQPPLRGRVVMGVDPGYRTGCKVAVVDATGKYLEGGVVYLHQPERARETLLAIAQRWGVQVIAIGNGTASRETEALVADVIKAAAFPLQYVMVSEAGASVYSASEAARAEFPSLDATQRGNVSIARRLQDPLAELVKIDPKALGVGLYQHDVDQKRLGEQLGTVVESCVNFVGVDLNTASAALLGYVAGLNSKTAKAIVAHRDEHGPFGARKQLLKVKGLGPKAFEQAAGFLRIPEAPDPLDNTAVHPESYPAARALLARYGDATTPLPEAAAHVRTLVAGGSIAPALLAAELGIGEPTLADMLDAMARPGRDPRDDAPPPLLRADVLKMEDLQPGMQLKGTVRNVVDFGAFVDIGVKQDGLVHVSEMADRFVKNPLDIVHVGDIVDVRVLSIDLARGRIGLSMRSG